MRRSSGRSDLLTYDVHTNERAFEMKCSFTLPQGLVRINYLCCGQ